MKTTLSILFLLLLPLALFAKDKAVPTQGKTHRLDRGFDWSEASGLSLWPTGDQRLKDHDPTGPASAHAQTSRQSTPPSSSGASSRSATGKGKVLHVKAGHPMIEVVDEWHYGANHGTEPVELIAFYAAPSKARPSPFRRSSDSKPVATIPPLTVLDQTQLGITFNLITHGLCSCACAKSQTDSFASTRQRC